MIIVSKINVYTITIILAILYYLLFLKLVAYFENPSKPKWFSLQTLITVAY